jgi:hypothetical protein
VGARGFAGLRPAGLAPDEVSIKLFSYVNYCRFIPSLLGLPAPTMTDPPVGEGVCDLSSAFGAIRLLLRVAVVSKPHRARAAVLLCQPAAKPAFTSGGSALGPRSAELSVSKTQRCR